MIDPISILEKHSKEIRGFHARRIGIFGSFARGEATEESDVDVFVDLEPEGFEFMNFMDFCDWLEELFGRSVDVIPKGTPKTAKGGDNRAHSCLCIHLVRIG